MSKETNLTIRAGNSGTVGDTGNELGLVVNLLVGPSGQEEPFDMTGQTVVFRIRRGTTEVLRKSTADSITLTEGTNLTGAASGVNNKIIVPITVAESRTIAAAGQRLTYDLERRQGSNQRTLLSGSVFVQPGANDD